jgi:hypothetical protein
VVQSQELEPKENPFTDKEDMSKLYENKKYKLLFNYSFTFNMNILDVIDIIF